MLLGERQGCVCPALHRTLVPLRHRFCACSGDQSTVKYVSQLAGMDCSRSRGVACAACLGAWSENRWVRAPFGKLLENCVGWWEQTCHNLVHAA